MKSLCILILGLLFTCGISAQDVELIYKDEVYRFDKEPRDFEYIDFKVDLSSYTKVAELRIRIDKQGKKSLPVMFGKLWEAANNMGANAFSVEEVSFENGQYVVVVDVFYFDDDEMQYNYSQYEDNIIIVFGDLNAKNEDKEKNFKLGKEKISLKPYTYFKYQNEVGEKAKISVGGFLGSSVTIVGEEYKLGRCFSLGGTSVMPAGGGVAVGSGGTSMGVGISITTGSVYPVDLNFGLFAMTILDTVQKQSENIETE